MYPSEIILNLVSSVLLRRVNFNVYRGITNSTICLGFSGFGGGEVQKTKNLLVAMQI